MFQIPVHILFIRLRKCSEHEFQIPVHVFQILCTFCLHDLRKCSEHVFQIPVHVLFKRFKNVS